MSMNDPLGDMLTRIRNAQLRGKSTVRTPASKLRAWVLDVLKAEGYIRGYEKAVAANDLTKAKEAFVHMQSVVDIIADKGIFHKNKAARDKSRLSSRVKTLAAAAA